MLTGQREGDGFGVWGGKEALNRRQNARLFHGSTSLLPVLCGESYPLPGVAAGQQRDAETRTSTHKLKHKHELASAPSSSDSSVVMVTDRRPRWGDMEPEASVAVDCGEPGARAALALLSGTATVTLRGRRLGLGLGLKLSSTVCVVRGERCWFGGGGSRPKELGES